MSDPLFFILTQGCKVNQYESQSIREAWTNQGMVECHDPRQADTILINTCAVTQRAIADLKRHVRKLHEQSPAASLVLTGCAIQAIPELGSLEGVTLAIDQAHKPLLKKGAGFLLSPGRQENTHAHQYPDFSISKYARARGVVKIQDGCSHRCTYCIIPSTRGRSMSREVQDILDEITRLFQAGIHELSLCGINLRHFGRDLHPRTDLWELLERIEETLGPTWQDRCRIRLSSLEPSELSPKGIKALQQSSLVCPHIHISLQSGSPSILRQMGRGHYRPEMIMNFVDQLRDIWPVFALGADIITGFPGETKDHFQETLACVRRLPLTYAHVFPYSRRPGTVAASLSDQVTHKERTSRAASIRALVRTKHQSFIQSLVRGSTLKVIFEDGVKGMSQFYLPCVLTQQEEIDPDDRTIHRTTLKKQDGHGLVVTLNRASRQGENV
ncbi:MAG: tRNA (N6-isopentenyl adenosine(37)-C2)-methylthiotransferase MiaB [Deltaproteobacteria bacterium]|nr:MAG: tRNA (N6-isopentenyl adenosine(37)-C2)-methylthiotransferase MiaB [Deltaproteobacteria bacterium]